MSRLEDLTEMLENPEELDPALRRYIEEVGEFGPCIRHPLVYSMLHHPAMNSYVNQQYRAKQAAVDEAYDNNEWSSYIWLHERPYRCMAFQEIMEWMNDATYWRLLGSIWIDSENIRQNPDEWFDLLQSDRDDREHIMTEEEQADLAAMDAVIPVYQGHTASRDDGWSWTTERATAQWFAKRFASLEKDEPRLSIGTVAKADVLAFFSRRNESEILVDRSKVIITKVVTR